MPDQVAKTTIMGTDIHLWVEYREPLERAKWSLLDEVPCSMCDDGVFNYTDAPLPAGACSFCGGTTKRRGRDAHPYDSRNYWLFARLTGVREPMLEPRGVPGDASDEYSEFATDPDGHSYSWLTLAELVRFVVAEADSTYGIGKFAAMVTDVMVPLGAKYGDDNVRIVFFFDD